MTAALRAWGSCSATPPPVLKSDAQSTKLTPPRDQPAPSRKYEWDGNKSDETRNTLRRAYTRGNPAGEKHCTTKKLSGSGLK